MLFAVLAKKAYRRNLQYRGSHLVHNLASAIFGVVYISIWMGLGEGRSLGEYGLKGMVSYIAFNQVSLWVALFLNNGLGIPESVRTGQISLELMRPVPLFYQLMSREWGQIAYQFVYKFLPIYFLYFFVFQLQVPSQLSTYAATAAALLFAAYISICINYLIGVTSLWTTESTWFYWLNYSFSMLLSGFFIPLEWLPGWLHAISVWSPYPYLLYHSTRIYLELESFTVLTGSVVWCLLFTVLCIGATRIVRRKLEVQGG
ncbi:ABC-2 family transporter protein [Paenibacillus aurantius]|uniref:ABC-2 family transporter protein n=1 Tax=Paenibacillus aurantius TaxID=2918900 RepID=A0AA96LH60_9BACL|nr:ABC-2 family transporter protein [Paenibacillus aurantius]WNQ11911.1 ABC-2 family transporter protein [Paenibacillus aurantius]